MSGMPEAFDLIVVGTGEAGAAPASRCRKEGWRVAVVDDQAYGGTCALRGCDPKKVLVGAADVVDWQRRMSGRGVAGDTRIDWPALMRFKRTFTDPVPEKREAALERSGIVTLNGVARFLAEDRLAVGEREFRAKHMVIATGAKPRPLGIPGEEYVRTSTDFLELDELPHRVAFIGAGYISLEFAHIVQRADSQAIVLGRGAPLAHFDQDVVQRLIAHTRGIGVDLRLDNNVVGVEPDGSAYRIHVETSNGAEVVEADLVIHGAGRVPDTKRLELHKAHVEVDGRGGIRVNEYLQSVSNPRVYAAGDATLPPGSLPLTPVAAYEGTIVASNLARGNEKTPDYSGTPSVVFTIPPLASVGMTEREARQQDLDIRVKMEDTASWFSNRRVHQPATIFKTIVDAGTNHVLGAHLLGPHAEEVINLFALAVRHRLTATDLKHMMYAYPTSASDVPYML